MARRKAQLLGEVEWLQRRIEALERSDAERRRTEEELAQSKALLQATIENLPFDFFALGPDGRYLMQNAASKQHWGDATGLLPEEVCQDQETLALWLNNNRRVFAGEKIDEEFELTCHAERRVYHSVMTPIRSGTQCYGILGMNVDITRRKRTEEALREIQSDLERQVRSRTAELSDANRELVMFRKFADAAGQGFSMADLDGHITYLNPALCRMLGEKDPHAVIGKNLSIYFGDEANRRGALEIGPALKRDGHWSGELPMLCRDGSCVPTWHNTFVIRDEDGTPLRMAVVIEDITERKRAREASEKEHRTLQHLLQSSDHERQLIAYEIHDGLAQQLAAAIMQFQAFNHLKDEDPQEAAQAYDAALRMLRQSHFETRRLIAGVRPPILDESGVVEAIAHLVNELRRQQGPSIEFRNSVTFDRLALTLENALYRIAQEGLTNACKHSRSKKVRVNLVQRGDAVRIQIRDWGIGFDTKRVQENHYGLEGIRQRTRLLGGTCRIGSKAGVGTRITVDLPLLARG